MNLTSNRFRFAAVLFVCWFASYLERFLINMALPFIGREFEVNEAGLGLLLSAFFAGYALIQLPGGWLADKFGARKMILFSIACFSLFSVGSGLAWSLTSLFVIRFLFGVFEGSFPTASFKAVSESFPRASRGRIQSILLATNPLSLTIAPLAAAPLIAAFGWRGMFIWASLVGVVALLLYAFGGKPITDAGQPASEAPQGGDIKAMLREASIWKISLVNFGVNVLIWGFLSWLPTYMMKVLKLDLMHVGFISTLPGIAGIVGMLAGGWLSDKIFEGREKYLLATTIAIAAASLFVMLNVPTLPVVIACQIIVAFSVKVAFSAIWALPLKVIDPRNMGAASGIVNLGSQLAGIASPAIMGYLIVLGHGSYQGAFAFLLGCSVISAGIALTVGTSRPQSADAGNEPCGPAPRLAQEER